MKNDDEILSAEQVRDLIGSKNEYGAYKWCRNNGVKRLNAPGHRYWKSEVIKALNRKKVHQSKKELVCA